MRSNPFLFVLFFSAGGVYSYPSLSGAILPIAAPPKLALHEYVELDESSDGNEALLNLLEMVHPSDAQENAVMPVSPSEVWAQILSYLDWDQLRHIVCAVIPPMGEGNKISPGAAANSMKALYRVLTRNSQAMQAMWSNVLRARYETVAAESWPPSHEFWQMPNQFITPSSDAINPWYRSFCAYSQAEVFLRDTKYRELATKILFASVIARKDPRLGRRWENAILKYSNALHRSHKLNVFLDNMPRPLWYAVQLITPVLLPLALPVLLINKLYFVVCDKRERWLFRRALTLAYPT